LIDAHEGRLRLFAWYSLYPFAAQAHWDTVSLRLLPVETLEDLRVSIVGYMDQLTPFFFADQSDQSEMKMRKDLLNHLGVYIHPLLLPQYHALAPDFFAWLEV